MAIIQRPDRKFDVRVTAYINGHSVERRTRGLKSKGDARLEEVAHLKELNHLKEMGIHKKVNWKLAKDQYYLQAQKKLSFSTFASMKSILELHTSKWNSRDIDSFVTSEIEDLIESVYSEDSFESKKKLLNNIRSVFKRQIETGHLKLNPCSDLRYGKGPEKELIAMSRQEIELLLRTANEMNHPWYPVWRVVYELGLRSGEGISLKWSDIDLENNRATISKSYCSKSKLIGPTKNRKARTIPVNKSLAIFLKEMKLSKPNGDFVLPHLAGWLRGEGAEILRSFQKDLKIRETNFHSLRASFITHLLLKGTPVTKVQQMVGHSDLKTTQRYVRLIASDLDGATDSISVNLESSIGMIIPFSNNL